MTDAATLTVAPSRPARALGRRQLRSAQRKAMLLDHAVRLAGLYGASTVTFDELARVAATSKSNVVLHFRNKQGLTLAIIDDAERRFFADVVAPCSSASSLVRLDALAELWMDWSMRTQGGCLMATLLHEFDAEQGVLRDRVCAFIERLRHVLVVLVDDGHRRGELASGVEADDVLFRLLAMTLAHNVTSRLINPAMSLRAAAAKASLLRQLAAPMGEA